MKRVSVIGAGSWGTTLAWILASKCRDKDVEVGLWVREEEVLSEVIETRENKSFLPGVELPENIIATSSLREAIEGVDVIVCVVPSHGIRGVFKEAAEYLKSDAIIVNASKGVEQGTLLTSREVLREILPDSFKDKVAALSGPSFAKEVSAGLPAAVSCASVHKADAAMIQELFSTPSFRVYTNTDPIGVELGGVLKNVIAIASGITDGLELGTNARAALITRGLNEISRLGVAMGGRRETFFGLSGVGDLVLTCTGVLSRNYTVGLRLGRGESMDEIVSSMKMVAEGVKTSHAVFELAKRHKIEMPITEEVVKVLYDGKAPKSAVTELMSRNPGEE
jgi:glycerol-3-phosphate dehydrogenase (NAD(P)+)